MKCLWLAALAVSTAITIPAQAQNASVKAGVEAWEKGDFKQAVDLWRPQAAKGDADAQFNLGQAYKLGRGVGADLGQAEQWYSKAAWQGHEQAEANYGLALFANGKRTESVAWIERAVQRGDPRAQYLLGTMLFNGDVVAKNWVRAYALVTRSAQTGLNEGTTALAQMDKHISLADRQAGLSLAQQYERDLNRGAISLPPMQQPAPVRVAKVTPPPPTAAPRKPAPATAPALPPAAEVARRPAAPPPAAPLSATPTGRWSVQLGAFGDPANARRLWSQVGSRFPGRSVSYVKSGSLTRVVVGPYSSSAEASRACGNVQPCVPVSK